jgi:hypothetical protein
MLVTRILHHDASVVACTNVESCLVVIGAH